MKKILLFVLLASLACVAQNTPVTYSLNGNYYITEPTNIGTLNVTTAFSLAGITGFTGGVIDGSCTFNFSSGLLTTITGSPCGLSSPGTSGQLIYNNSGSLAGTTGITTNGSGTLTASNLTTGGLLKLGSSAVTVNNATGNLLGATLATSGSLVPQGALGTGGDGSGSHCVLDNGTWTVQCGSGTWHIVQQSSNYTILSTDFNTKLAEGNYEVSTSTSPVTFTLPSTVPTADTCVAVGNQGSSTVTLSPGTHALMGIVASVTIGPQTGYEVCSDGSNYYTKGCKHMTANDVGPVITGTDTGSSTAYVVTLGTNPTSLVPGLRALFIAQHNNSTTTPTFNLNGLGAITITRNGQLALALNDIMVNKVADVIYDGTDWELQNPSTIAFSNSGTGVLYQAAPTGGATGSGSFQTLYTYTLPGGTLTSVGGLRIACGVEQLNTTGLQIRILFGSSNTSASQNTNAATLNGQMEIFNNSSTSSQWYRSQFLSSGTSLGTTNGSFNFSTSGGDNTLSNVTITCQAEANSGQAYSVGGFYVERIAQ